MNGATDRVTTHNKATKFWFLGNKRTLGDLVYVRGFHLKHFFSAIARRDLFTVFWVPEVRSKSRGRLLKAQASPRPLKFWPRSTRGRKLKVGILSSN